MCVYEHGSMIMCMGERQPISYVQFDNEIKIARV